MWLTFNSDGILNTVTWSSQWSLLPGTEPVIVTQRWDFLHHSIPSCWIPFCVEEPVSTREGRSSWLPEWPCLRSESLWWHSAGKEAHSRTLQESYTVKKNLQNVFVSPPSTWLLQIIPQHCLTASHWSMQWFINYNSTKDLKYCMN